MLLLKECRLCGTPFTPAIVNQVYCCYNCKKKACSEKAKEKRANRVIKAKTRPLNDGVPSIKDVVLMTIEHKQKTGRLISYGKMVAIIERDGF